jgi:hypothetical protein
MDHLRARCTTLATEAENIEGLAAFYTTVVEEAEQSGELCLVAADVRASIIRLQERTSTIVAEVEILKERIYRCLAGVRES